MASNMIVNDILKEYQNNNDLALLDLESRKNEIYNVIPRIKIIDDEISQISIGLAKNLINNKSNSDKLLNEFYQKSIKLKIEKNELLSKYNYPDDYLTIKHKCNLCKDTGFIENKKCSCFKNKLIQYAYKESNLYNLLEEQNFENFNFEYYSDTIDPKYGISPRKNAQDIYKTCLDFVNSFNSIEDNLLFTGSTGLGKTFLSSCIAKDLLDNEKTVFYQTAFKIFNLLEEYKFSKDKDSLLRENITTLFNVDLLIIDDLGTEFINSYTSSEFFNILNSRLLDKKKTIISTNLNMEKLNEMYSERVISRIIGHYKLVTFFGDDIRKNL